MVSQYQILTPKKIFVMLHFTCTCIKFFTKSIQIIKKNIAYFYNQWKYSVFFC